MHQIMEPAGTVLSQEDTDGTRIMIRAVSRSFTDTENSSKISA